MGNSSIIKTGGATTASNQGTGTGVFKQQTGTDLEFNSLLGVDSVSVALAGSEIKISAPQVSTNTADITFVSGLTDTNTTDITFVSGTTDTNATNITFVSGTTDTNATNIATNVADITFVSGTTDTNATNIATNVTNITFVSGTTDTNATNISTNVTNIATNVTDITFVSGLTDTNTTDISFVSGLIGDNDGDIAFISGLATDNATDITFVSGTTDTNATNIATNVTDIAFVSGTTDTNAGNISTNTTDITTNATDITFVSGTTDTNATNIATNVTDIAFVSGTTDTNATNITFVSGVASTAVQGGNSLGATDVFSTQTGTILDFKGVSGLGSISVTSDGSNVFVSGSAAAGEANTASNLGGDEGLFWNKNGVDLEFRGITAGDGVAFTSGATDITVSAPDVLINTANIATNVTDITFVSGLADTNSTDITFISGNYLPLSGGDMTGVLNATTLNADLVSGTTISGNFISLSGMNATALFADARKTGRSTGGEIAKVDTTDISVAGGTGYIVDYTVDPHDVSPFTWNADANYTITAMDVTEFTFVGINTAGAVVQTSGVDWTPAEEKTITSLGWVNHPTGIIDFTVFSPHMTFGNAYSTSDLSHAIGDINTEGNVFGPSGTSLMITKTAGEVFSANSNVGVSVNAPNNVTSSLLDPANFYYTFNDGTGGFNTSGTTTDIQPALYDTSNVNLSGVAAGEYTNQRIYLEPTTDTVVIQYGQTVYSGLALAESSISTESLSISPLLDNYLFRGWLTVKGDATDLSDSSQALFFEASNFGQGGGGSSAGGGAGQTTLQQAYDNTADGTITTDATRTALKIKEKVGLGGNLIEGLDTNDEVIFSVGAAGEVAISGNITTSLSGTTNIGTAAIPFGQVYSNESNSNFVSGDSVSINGIKAVAPRFLSWHISTDTAPLLSGTYSVVSAPVDFTPTAWRCNSDISGTATIDIRRKTYANYDGTFVAGDSIAGTEKITINNVNGVKGEDTALTSWSGISAGDQLEIFLDGDAVGASRVDFTLIMDPA